MAIVRWNPGHVLSSGVRETDAIRASFDSFTLLR